MVFRYLPPILFSLALIILPYPATNLVTASTDKEDNAQQPKQQQLVITKGPPSDEGSSSQQNMKLRAALIDTTGRGCGNRICEEEYETCQSCPNDCCAKQQEQQQPLQTTTTIAAKKKQRQHRKTMYDRKKLVGQNGRLHRAKYYQFQQQSPNRTTTIFPEPSSMPTKSLAPSSTEQPSRTRTPTRQPSKSPFPTSSPPHPQTITPTTNAPQSFPTSNVTETMTPLPLSSSYTNTQTVEPTESSMPSSRSPTEFVPTPLPISRNSSNTPTMLSLEPTQMPSSTKHAVSVDLSWLAPTLLPSSSGTPSHPSSTEPSVTTSSARTQMPSRLRYTVDVDLSWIVPTPMPSSSSSSTNPTDPSPFPASTTPSLPSTFTPNLPSRQPSTYPSTSTSRDPSLELSSVPSSVPSPMPSSPNNERTVDLPLYAIPSTSPSVSPSTGEPSERPSATPSGLPSILPSHSPSRQPSAYPSTSPSAAPQQPTGQPSERPSATPSRFPSPVPSSSPSTSPSTNPSTSPSENPSMGPSTTGPTALQPYKVVILTGQSNMVGPAKEDSLLELINSPVASIADKYKHLRTVDGKWMERDDVLMHVYRDRGPNGGLVELVGKLKSVGYGANAKRFGPEVGIGHVVGDAHGDNDNPIILVKMAWNGVDLAINLRPPSSLGKYNGIPGPLPYDNTDNPPAYGAYYNKLLTYIEDAVTKMSSGEYDAIFGTNIMERGFDLTGLIYFQGYNDVIKEDKVAEYESNMANFIRDIRIDIQRLLNQDGSTTTTTSTPPRSFRTSPVAMSNHQKQQQSPLPIVIGELGMHGRLESNQGETWYPRLRDLRAAQWSMTIPRKYPEFENNVQVAAVSTCVSDQYSGHYHYFDRADHFYCAGELMGQALLDLIEKGEEFNLKGHQGTHEEHGF